MVSFKEYMSESNPITRWRVLRIGLIGGFCGAALTVIFALAGVIA